MAEAGHPGPVEIAETVRCPCHVRTRRIRFTLQAKTGPKIGCKALKPVQIVRISFQQRGFRRRQSILGTRLVATEEEVIRSSAVPNRFPAPRAVHGNLARCDQRLEALTPFVAQT